MTDLRAKYAAMKVIELKKICREKGISNCTTKKKAELVEVIVSSIKTSKSSSKPSVRSSTPIAKVTKPKVTKPKVTKPKVAKSKIGMSKVTAYRVTGDSDEGKEDPTLLGREGLPAKREDLWSDHKIILFPELIMTKDGNYVALRKDRQIFGVFQPDTQTIRSLTKTELTNLLRLKVDVYHTGFVPLSLYAMKMIYNPYPGLRDDPYRLYHSKGDIESTLEYLKSKYLTSDPKPKKSPPKKSPRKKAPVYVPGKYEHMKIPRFDVKSPVKKTPKTKAREMTGITFAEFLLETKRPEFLKAFTQSAKDLMTKKLEFYNRRLVSLKEENRKVLEKMTAMIKTGIPNQDIRDIFPNAKFDTAFELDLAELIKVIERKRETLTEESIAEGLDNAMNDSEYGLAVLVGREEAKDQIVSQLYAFSKGYQTFLGSFNNIMITGGAGTGKTALAQVIAYVFSQTNILATDKVKIITRTDMVGQYIGQTGPQTRRILMNSLEGVLFIDEAYQLTPCPEAQGGGKSDFGAEAVTELVNFLDKYVGMNVTIVAGYEGVMTRCFMTFNEGLPRRFPYRYNLASYSPGQLTDILLRSVRRRVPDSVKIDDETANFIFTIIAGLDEKMPKAIANQGGDMLNLASSLVKMINSSYKIQWENGNLKHNLPILMSGINDYLSMKGLEASI